MNGVDTIDPTMSSTCATGTEDEPDSAVAANQIPNVLPHERVFPIQIGCELFKLSGASISSDGMYLEVAPGVSLAMNSLTGRTAETSLTP
jgi:hypothetical protein